MSANGIATPITGIVRFQTNIPQRLTLKFAQGKESEGQYGTQFWHTLVPEGQAYLQPIVEQKIAELGIQDGDTVEVCKREVKNGLRRGTEWQVQRVIPEAPIPAKSSAPGIDTETEPISKPVSAPNGNNGHSGNQEHAAIPPTVEAALLATAERVLLRVIDIAAKAEEHARELGLAGFIFGPNNVQAICNTVLIGVNQSMGVRR